ncbi:two-component sensor histidine kinase [Paenibacillus pectinilyticus]|uniref:histidine kinase n=1 Tax=Paenibacillus pectinilyticus TaxID=512399 RepID=A0A1C1A3D9_9BACL|nr:sensor histidine kinase [Paenibacillus pectinilyticus]OCT15074.1 two-component sensor histidine kinase [Paenibacillus pectinilyticus]
MRQISFRRFSNLSIRNKLFATYLLVVSVPFILLFFIHLNITTKESEDQTLFTAKKVLEETRSYLEYKAASIAEVLNFIALNDQVQSLVIADPEQYEDVNVWGFDASKLSKILYQSRYNEDISAIRLYMKEGLAEATENTDYLRLGKLETTEWYKKFSASNESFAWLPASEFPSSSSSNMLSIVRKIPNSHNVRQFNGIVRADISQKAMYTVLDHASFTPAAEAVLFNDRGDILSVSSNFHDNQSVLNVISQNGLSSNKSNYWNEDFIIGGKRMLLGIQEIASTDLHVALVVPYSDILNSSNKARNRLISIFLMIIPFMLPLSFFVAGSATKRIRNLILHTRKLKNGDFEVAPLPVNADEIGELTHNFNKMVLNISELMDETYSLGREVKNKELKALQAQINPHFLYNTLDLINIMAIESGAKEISTVVDELAVFYKLSLSNGKEMVTLHNEIKHVEAYVHIQNMRFGNGIGFHVDIPSELYEIQVPKIILQPLIENAILHGILEKDSEEGSITVRAEVVDEDVYITVEDDGIGLTEMQIKKVMEGHSSKRTGGFGVRNIMERIQLTYGNRYGIRYESVPGSGTKAILHIPNQPI